MDSVLINKFRKTIQSEIDEKRYAISQGNITDLLVYKELCSTVTGLEIAMAHFNGIVQSLGEPDEDKA